MERKPIVTNKIYHVYSKSIAGFKIFNYADEFSRMMKTIQYYQNKGPSLKFSDSNLANPKSYDKGKEIVDIVAYCLMPTHFHLILKQLLDDGISKFIHKILDSYTKYFNTKYKRKGPLWEGRFKDVSVENDEQLLHLTRYIHLNPVTAYLVNNPEEWQYSSYSEYLLNIRENERICNLENLLKIDPKDYKEFVENRIAYQREIGKIKSLLIEETSLGTIPTPGVG